VSGTGFEAAVKGLAARLEGRAWLAGGAAPSAADVANWGALAAARQWDALRRGAAYAGVAKWHDSLPAALPAAAEALAAYMPAAAAASKAKQARIRACARTRARSHFTHSSRNLLTFCTPFPLSFMLPGCREAGG
jgi:hypothetical protein